MRAHTQYPYILKLIIRAMNNERMVRTLSSGQRKNDDNVAVAAGAALRSLSSVLVGWCAYAIMVNHYTIVQSKKNWIDPSTQIYACRMRVRKMRDTGVAERLDGNEISQRIYCYIVWNANSINPIVCLRLYHFAAVINGLAGERNRWHTAAVLWLFGSDHICSLCDRCRSI